MIAMTPEAASRSFRRASLMDLRTIDHDEAFVFRFPSTDIVNEVNGDGDLIEIWDVAEDFQSVTTEFGELATTPQTEVLYR